MTTRIFRQGEPEPPDLDWQQQTPSERMALVWELTRQCLAWNHDPPVNPDFRDLSAELYAQSVELLVVGAHGSV